MTSSQSSRTAILWLALVLMLALAIAFLLPVTPQDYWWYLRIGRDTLAIGTVPRLDELSASQVGAPMVYHSWGAAVLFWLLYQLGGLSLTVLLRGMLIVTSYGLVWRISRNLGAGRISSALILLLAILASSNNWSIRPQLFAYPLFSLGLYLIYGWHLGKKKSIFWLPLISLLWVNLHGSFVMLFLLSGMALLFGRGDRRSLGLAIVASLLVTMLNPRGLGAWSYIYHSLTVSSNSFSAEWSPPVNAGWQMNLFFAWLLVFPLLVGLSRRRLDQMEWSWFLSFGSLALMGERYVIWFVFILAILTPLLVEGWEQKLIKSVPSSTQSARFLTIVNLVLVTFMLILPVSLLPGVREDWWPSSPPTTENTPIGATEWLAAHPDLPGPLWTELGFASYIEFALPSRPPWMDTRFELYPVQQWQDYRAIANARYDWRSRLDGTGANILMISVALQPDLLVALVETPGWCERYRDNTAVIFSRCQ